MPKDYTQGKIYRIVSKSGQQYVGSTTETLSRRLTRHRWYIKNPRSQGITSLKILRDDPEAKIVLIENYPCQNSEELHKRERFWIEHIEGGCVNIVHPTRTIREYQIDNKEKVKIWKKNDRERRKNIISQKQKEYRDRNKKQITQRQSIYYNTKKTILLQKVKCQCGREIVKCSLKRHQKSKIHLDLINK